MKPPVLDPSWPPEVLALYRHDLQEIWRSDICPHIWNQYHNQLDVYTRLLPSGEALDVLDVGCAQATLALLLAERGHSVTAVDLRPSFLDYARTRHTHGRIRFLAANAMALSIQERFDVVFANQLVEHVVRPVPLLRRLRDLLRPGGRLIVSTPNGDYFRNPLPAFGDLGDPLRYEDRQFTADGDGHFFAYQPRELVRIMRAAGTTGVRLSFFESPWISGHVRLRHLHGLVPAKWLRAADRLTLAAPSFARRAAHQMVAVGIG